MSESSTTPDRDDQAALPLAWQRFSHSSRNESTDEQETLMTPATAPTTSTSVPNATAADWVDVLEQRMWELCPDLGCPPEGRWRRFRWALRYRLPLRVRIRTELTEWMVWGQPQLPHECEIPWNGCPRHGDLLELAGMKHGWRCSAEECDYTLRTTHRLLDCGQRAIAALSDADDSHRLLVCEGHLHSEAEGFSYGGEPVTVTYLDPPDGEPATVTYLDPPAQVA
jgi:hypothetical protein